MSTHYRVKLIAYTTVVATCNAQAVMYMWFLSDVGDNLIDAVLQSMLFADIWITTGGTKNHLTRRFGEAVHECVSQQDKKRPVLIGFTKLNSPEEINKQSRTIDEEEVRRRFFFSPFISMVACIC